MADIKISFPLVVSDNKSGGFEGVYSNDANDPGGLTVYGLERLHDGDWEMWPYVLSIVNRGGNVAYNIATYYTTIYASAVAYHKKKYWDALSLDSVASQKIATELYSIGLNLGLKTAGNFLQQSLNILSPYGSYADLPITGYIGPLTLAALASNKRPDLVLSALHYLQGAQYISLGLQNKALRVFEAGWFNRAETLG